MALLSEEVAYAFNLVTPALPNISKAFSTPHIAWVATVFTVTGAITAPLIGKFADRDGKKKWLLIVTGSMALGSLVVAVAPSFGFVLAGRALEGVGLAIVPLVYSLMRDIFPERLLAMGVSIATAGIGVTTITGPIVAGALIDHFGYRGVFTALAIFPAVLGVLIAVFVPESTLRARCRIDYLGALLLGAAIAVGLFVLDRGGQWGWTSGATAGCVAGVVILLALWGVHTRRTAEPLIDLSVIRGRAVLTTAVVQFVAQGVIAVHFVLLAYIVQTPRSLGIEYGLGGDAGFMARITTPAGVISVLMGVLVGLLTRRYGARLPSLIGFVLIAIGSVALAVSHASFLSVLLGYSIYAFGGGLISAVVPNLVIAATPVRLQAVTASTVNVVGSLGSAIAVQVVFAILAGHTLTTAAGAPIYANSGFVTAYVLTIGLTVVGLAAAVVAPRGKRSPVVDDDGVASTS
ncbi:MFS transporter [Nocardia coffeae]|uniref:MFS transporter n=1 Tax=Nocardia coffeae TaxID=2873381 RepID=UPI00355775DC